MITRCSQRKLPIIRCLKYLSGPELELDLLEPLIGLLNIDLLVPGLLGLNLLGLYLLGICLLDLFLLIFSLCSTKTSRALPSSQGTPEKQDFCFYTGLPTKNETSETSVGTYTICFLIRITPCNCKQVSLFDK